MNTSTAEVTIGIDLGGTGIRVIALGLEGEVRAHKSVATPRTSTSPEMLVDDLVALIHSVADRSRLTAVGIGASGPIDTQGVIRNPDTLPAFSHFPLTGMIADALGVACVIDNDAVTAAIGENTYGAAKDSGSVLMVTLGTGVGVSVLLDGEPFRAADGTHPEAGHIPVPGPSAPCYCGLDRCWEQLASRTALNRLAHGRTKKLAAAAADDAAAAALFREYGERVGVGTSALLTIFKPEKLVFGGSGATFLPLFSAGLDAALHRAGGVTTPYAEADLGDLAGAVGAAVLARR